MAANCKSETQKLLMKHYGNQHERPCDVTMCDPMEGGRVKEAKGRGRETEGEREGDRRGEGGRQKGRRRETYKTDTRHRDLSKLVSILIAIASINLDYMLFYPTLCAFNCCIINS